MQEFIFDFVPPSTNTAYRIVKLGKFHSLKMTPRGKEFKKDVAEIVKNLQHKKYNGKIGVFLEIHFKDKRKRDIDNYSKLLIDSIKGILFEDDDQIFELLMQKYIDCGKNKTVLQVFEMNEDG